LLGEKKFASPTQKRGGGERIWDRTIKVDE